MGQTPLPVLLLAVECVGALASPALSWWSCRCRQLYCLWR